MKCFYINLDAATDRRRNLEASFRAAAPAHWELIRVAALGPADVANRPGTCTGPEKGCFLSHVAAIAATATTDEDVFVVEDDTCFSKRTFSTLDHLVTAPSKWDVLFTDVTFLDTARMLASAKQYGRLKASGQFILSDLSRTGFAASSAYMVRGASKAKLLAALAPDEPLDRAYDVQLRHLALGGEIMARACLPFLTSLSDDADGSSIQAPGWRTRDETIRAFRRLLFVDRDLAALGEAIDRLDERYGDEASRLVGKVLGIFSADAFPERW